MTAAGASKPRAARRTADRSDRIRRALGQHFGPSQLCVEEDACAVYRRDASEAEGQTPVAVVRVQSQADIQRALVTAAELKVPVVPRGGGTGKTGGAVSVAGGIVLDLLALNRIKEIDRREHVAVVEPGVVLSAFQSAVHAEGLFYAPDPNSRVGCTLGGNVATNAGGPRAFKYGVTGRHVLGIEAFLMGGRRIFAGRRTQKGVTGYDLSSLLVGSEGTLAVFGELTLRLLSPPESTLTVLVAFERRADAAEAVGDIVELGIGPSCLELLDLRVLGSRLLPELVGNELGSRAGSAESLLLIELDGPERVCELGLERIRAACSARGAKDSSVARNPAERDRLWEVRSNMSSTLRRLARHKLSEDIAVPRRRLGALLEQLDELSRRLGVRSAAYGHAGDGNLHVNFLWDDAADAPRVQAAIRELFERTIGLGGTLSGEHGIGVLKAPYLHLEQPPEVIALEQSLKRAFDPENLLNPGKIFARPAAAAPK